MEAPEEEEEEDYFGRVSRYFWCDCSGAQKVWQRNSIANFVAKFE